MNTEIKLYADESLESFLLRCCMYQDYQRYAHFAQDIWQDTLIQHEAMVGAFPFELSRVNVYKAQTSSQMRIRVLLTLERQLKLNDFGIIRLVLAHSKASFSPGHKAVYRSGVDYPHAFLRKHCVPICPKCLEESTYIRQLWHFIPYQVCHKHQCQLVHECPVCGRRLDYQQSELLDNCECGFPLVSCSSERGTDSAILVARWLAGEAQIESGLMSQQLTQSGRFGFLFWYLNRYGEIDDTSFEGFVDCCTTWPQKLDADLDSIVLKADIVRTRPWSKTYFGEVFGPLLKECRNLPSRELSKNPVLQSIVQYFSRLVANYPRDRTANIGDVLVSPLEASTLVSCSTDEIYRLYQFGELKAQLTPKLHSKIENHHSVFTLRSIVELKFSRMCSETDGLNHYLPE
ncbi:TniQ family protein [Vibrio fluvialis]|nr:TniQ family protein [Vibrio fluvialis]